MGAASAAGCAPAAPCNIARGTTRGRDIEVTGIPGCADARAPPLPKSSADAGTRTRRAVLRSLAVAASPPPPGGMGDMVRRTWLVDAGGAGAGAGPQTLTAA